MTFDQFAKAIRTKWEQMKKREVFIIDAEKDTIWDVYLNSFPEGTNPIFRERTEHDCNCCKAFIRNIGNTVVINPDFTLDSVWNAPGLSGLYAEVAQALHTYVTGYKVRTVYRTVEAKYGVEKNIELAHEHGKPSITWHHFSGETGSLRVASPGQVMGEHSTQIGVFRRGMESLSSESVKTVLDLISDNNLYRGSEHQRKLQEFLSLQVKYSKLPAKDTNQFLHYSLKENIGAALIRNTAIGTLLIDLNEGKTLEAAVKSYEDKVSGTNYKRPKALVTASMLKSANQTLVDLDLLDSVPRRHAVISDVSINNVLWASGKAQAVMAGNSLMDLLGDQVKAKTKAPVGAADMNIDDFVQLVLPTASAVEVLLENKHRGNLVNITTGVNQDAKSMFAWDSPFGWSYTGDVADSDLRTQVQARGGSVTGAFRFSHSWNHEGARNTSLMDLHVFMPANGRQVKPNISEAYGNLERVGWNNRDHHNSGGKQDVDYTEAAPDGYIPVENITFPDLNKMPDGDYQCQIHNWSKRTYSQGFHAEIEFQGQVFAYVYQGHMKNHEWVSVATVTKKGNTFTIRHHLPLASSVSQDLWSMKTNDFVPVQTMMLSPNHWDGKQVGNKHHFFLLEGANNPEATRGMYNEFLTPELNQHRKVFEVLASKFMVNPADKQLAGLGFSSTVRADATVRVTTAEGKRVYNLKF